MPINMGELLPTAPVMQPPASPSSDSTATDQVLDKDLLIACGTGAVRIQRAQREGKGAQDAGEFLRGFPLTAGERVN